MTDLQDFLHAAAFAARKRRLQKRKDAEASAYINHPLDVAAILAEEVGVTDAITLVAAVLHDTLEDTETTPEDLATDGQKELLSAGDSGVRPPRLSNWKHDATSTILRSFTTVLGRLRAERIAQAARVFLTRANSFSMRSRRE